MLSVVAILSILASLAVPAYQGHIDRSNNSRAIADLTQIGMLIQKYRLNHDDQLPLTLEEVGWTKRDPWGAAYAYLNFSTIKGNGNGQKRKDHNLVPINTEFDLYSKGKDGASRSPLTAQASRDDIIWASDGSFVGLASEY